MRLRPAYFSKTGDYFVYIFEQLGGVDPPMAQTEALAVGITEMRCSELAEMYTKRSKMHLGSILVNSAVCYNCEQKS